MARDEFLCFTHFKDKGNAQGEILDDGLDEAGDSVLIPSFKPLEAGQFDLASLDFAVPISDVAVTCFQGCFLKG